MDSPVLSLDEILHGDAVAMLRTFPAECVDTVVTSPPYFQQRNYESVEAQVGQEETPQDYVQALVGVFAECRRVLRPEGTIWIVLGDKFQKGELLGMPWRVALGLKDDGWYLRSHVVWHKPNAMPSSAKKRPTVDHDSIFLFSKGKDYFYDADAIREPHVTFSENSRMKGGRNHFFTRDGTPEKGKNEGNSNLHNGRWDQAFHPKGRNKRTVWSIPLSKCREAHFAVFPESLVQTCILATTCAGGVVLDPFIGSGTTALVARPLNRHYIGIDCVEKYCEMARRRLDQAGATTNPLSSSAATRSRSQSG